MILRVKIKIYIYIYISEDSRKLVRRSHERCRTRSENIRRFRKMPEDFRRLPKTFEEDPKIFWPYTNKLKNNLRDKLYSSEIIDTLTSEDMENTPLETQM